MTITITWLVLRVALLAIFIYPFPNSAGVWSRFVDGLFAAFVLSSLWKSVIAWAEKTAPTASTTPEA